MASKTFAELAKDPVGTMYYDHQEGDLRFCIIRSHQCLCAYIGVPLNSPLAGKHYDDIGAPCYGGLTFGEAGDGKYYPEAWYWYGWDYAHLGDQLFSEIGRPHIKRHGWTVGDVLEDSQEVLDWFRVTLQDAKAEASACRD